MTAARSGAPELKRDVLGTLRRIGLNAVIVIDDAKDAVPMARALEQGGLPCIEITMRTPAAIESIKRIAAEMPDVLIGAGTVLTPEHARDARAAGAQFMVSPGLNPAMVDYCIENGIPVFPGIATPTEIETALRHGLSVLKVFPSEALGGVAYLKAIAGPFGKLEFLPSGGISAANLADYLAYERVVACGGSWMAPQSMIKAGEFDRIRDETAKAVAIAATAKGKTK
jgi:2-dehydro-3-deoxyphosphogluconate aldolase/(4S)-4-hydroxy-2-oxoglutarate aldolase